MLLEHYSPKNFGQEYYQLKGMPQYPMFVAVALGVKPSFDDWVDISIYDKFVDACAKYGLVVEPDVMFETSQEDKKNVVGGENITTTFQYGKRFSPNETCGSVHLIVSKTKERAVEAKRFGWYSVIVNNRSTNKPFVDHLRFGKCLGYPDCCVDFFRRFNNWRIYNHPYETFKNTPQMQGRSRGSYYCNNFLMDHSFFFIHHLPCSYRCKSTVELASRVENAISQVEPDYVKRTVGLLKKPLLVFGEKNFIIFDGKLTRQGNTSTLSYSDCEYLQNPARPEDSVNFFESIKGADTIVVDESKVAIKRGTSLIERVDKKKEWFAIDFD
jgi:hypothetical protein